MAISESQLAWMFVLILGVMVVLTILAVTCDYLLRRIKNVEGDVDDIESDIYGEEDEDAKTR